MSGPTSRSQPRRAFRSTDISPTDLLAAVHAFRPAHHDAGLSVTVDPGSANPTIRVTDQERMIETDLADLTRVLAGHGTEPTAEAIAAAFRDWVDTRPVCDAAAEQCGIVTVAWAHRESRPRWRVSVPRASGICAEWVPSVHTTPTTVHRIHSQALRRARDLIVSPLASGDVTVWVYRVNPVLSTATLTQPGTLRNGAAETADLWVAFSPDRPVVVAARVAATRLAEESTEPHILMPLRDLDQIGWC